MGGASILGQGTKIAEAFQTLGISADVLRVLPDNQVARVVSGYYRALAQALHPDLNPDSKERFNEVNNAYQQLEVVLSDSRFPQILAKLREARTASPAAINSQRELAQKLEQTTREIEELKRLFVSFVVTMERLAPDAKILFPGAGQSSERLPLFAYGVYTFNMVDHEGVEGDDNRKEYEVPARYCSSISTDSGGVVVKANSKNAGLNANLQHLLGLKVMGAVDATLLQELRARPVGDASRDQLRIGGVVAEQEKLLPYEVSRQVFTKAILPRIENTVGYGDCLVLVDMTAEPRFFVLPSIDSAGSTRSAAVQFKSGV